MASGVSYSARVELRRWRRCALVCAVVGLGVASEVAAKDVPPILRPSTRARFVLLGAGPSAGIGGLCYAGYYYGGSLYNEAGFQRFGCGGAVKLSQELGMHFTGGGDGPAISALLQEEVLSYGYLGLTVAPKLSWDIQPIEGVGFYVSPNVALGYHSSRWQGHPTLQGGDLQGGVGLKLSLGDRGLLYTQLPHFDFVFGPGYSMIRYDFILGAGVTF